MKDFDEDDLMQRGGAGATGIFGVAKQDLRGEGSAAKDGADAAVAQASLMARPVPASAPNPTTPAPTPAADGSAGGFTQLLRTLAPHEPLAEHASPENAKASSPKAEPVFPAEPSFAPLVAAEPAPALKPAARSFTQMFEAVKAEVASSPAPSTPTQAPMPAAPVQSAVLPAPSAPVRFTQLFQALDSLPPAATASQPAARAEAATASASPGVRSGGATDASRAGVPAVTPQANDEGFTQMFQALESDTAPKADPPFSAVPAGAAAPVVTPAPSSPPQQPSSAGGGITQLLRAIDLGSLKENAPAAPAAMAAAAPVPPAPAAVPAAAAPAPMAASAPPAAAEMLSSSSLTAMFQTAGPTRPDPVHSEPIASAVPPVSALPLAAPSAGAAPLPTPASGGAGSFTQMFRTLDEQSSQPVGKPEAFPPRAAASQPPTPAEAPASFTQFFSSAAKQTNREPSQADAFPPIAPAGSGRSEYGSAPPSSSAYGEQAPNPWDEPRFSAPPAERPMFPSASYAEPQQRGGSPPASSGGGNIGAAGLTQLLRTLDSPPAAPGQASQPRAESVFTPPPVSAPYPKVDLPPPSQSGATTAFRLPQIPAAAAPASAPAGPGEFTRIIQASAMRESARQGGGAAAGPAASAPAAAPASGGGSGFSVSSSGMPMMPSAPVMPSMPMMPGGGGGGGGFSAPQMPMMPSMPSMPSVPNLTVTAPSDPAAGGGSKLLPILLIVVIVLLVAVLLAVVLLMKH